MGSYDGKFELFHRDVKGQNVLAFGKKNQDQYFRSYLDWLSPPSFDTLRDNPFLHPLFMPSELPLLNGAFMVVSPCCTHRIVATSGVITHLCLVT